MSTSNRIYNCPVKGCEKRNIAYIDSHIKKKHPNIPTNERLGIVSQIKKTVIHRKRKNESKVTKNENKKRKKDTSLTKKNSDDDKWVDLKTRELLRELELSNSNDSLRNPLEIPNATPNSEAAIDDHIKITESTSISNESQIKTSETSTDFDEVCPNDDQISYELCSNEYDKLRELKTKELLRELELSDSDDSLDNEDQLQTPTAYTEKINSKNNQIQISESTSNSKEFCSKENQVQISETSRNAADLCPIENQVNISETSAHELCPNDDQIKNFKMSTNSQNLCQKESQMKISDIEEYTDPPIAVVSFNNQNISENNDTDIWKDLDLINFYESLETDGSEMNGQIDDRVLHTSVTFGNTNKAKTLVNNDENDQSVEVKKIHENNITDTVKKYSFENNNYQANSQYNAQIDNISNGIEEFNFENIFDNSICNSENQDRIDSIISTLSEIPYDVVENLEKDTLTEKANDAKGTEDQVERCMKNTVSSSTEIYEKLAGARKNDNNEITQSEEFKERTDERDEKITCISDIFSNLNTNIGYQMLDLLSERGENRYRFSYSLNESILGTPHINCEQYPLIFFKKYTTKKFRNFKRKTLRRFNKISQTVSIGISHCILKSVELYEVLQRNNCPEYITNLVKCGLMYFCYVQRMWRAVMRYNILYDMGMSRATIRKFWFGECINSNYLFTTYKIEDILEYVKRPLYFTPPYEVLNDNEMHKKCAEWIMLGNQEMELFSIRKEIANYICIKFPFQWLPKSKVKYSKKYNKLQNALHRKLHLAIEVLWSARCWYLATHAKNNTCDLFYDVCHTSCIAKKKFDNMMLYNVENKKKNIA